MNIPVVTGSLFRIAVIENIVVQILNGLIPIVKNYGIAIIIVTLIFKLLMLPLTLKQEKSMLKMKTLQPKIDEINKKYSGDKAKINEMTAQLYKEERVNPFSSCLPILIQLPIFVALYWTFQGDAIPANANFLWFNLKAPDAIATIAGFNINILPILSGILMVAQQKLMTPQSSSENKSENTMQTMMYIMPIMMTFLFYSFPSGVNLYYVVNSILTIVIQILVIKKVRETNE